MTTWDLQEKPGTASGYGWTYDELNMTYDQAIDVDTGLVVKYDGLGTTQTWVNQSKS